MSHIAVRMPVDSTAAPFEIENLRVRAALMARLRQMMQGRRLTQVQAARWFNVSQCRISHLVNDQFNRFTIDTLVNMLASAGVHVSVTFDAQPAIAPRQVLAIRPRLRSVAIPPKEAPVAEQAPARSPLR